MRDAADSLDFERAIALREQVKKLNERLRESGKRSHEK
jgi:excinuclease UvrABC helicase subunit UvrB